jgi:hypothetical protein
MTTKNRKKDQKIESEQKTENEVKQFKEQIIQISEDFKNIKLNLKKILRVSKKEYIIPKEFIEPFLSEKK